MSHDVTIRFAEFLPRYVFDALRSIPGVYLGRQKQIHLTRDLLGPVEKELAGLDYSVSQDAEKPGKPGKAPNLSNHLWPFQREGAFNLASDRKRGLHWPTGSGKSGTTLAAFDLAGDRLVLVVTRAIGRESWARDAAWATDRVVAILIGLYSAPVPVTCRSCGAPGKEFCSAQCRDWSDVPLKQWRKVYLASKCVLCAQDSTVSALRYLNGATVHVCKHCAKRHPIPKSRPNPALAADKLLETYRKKGSKCFAAASAGEAVGRGASVVVVGWETLAVRGLEEYTDKDGTGRRKREIKLRPDLQRQWDRVVFDEHHYGKGRLADRTQAALELSRLSKNPCWTLTATPIRDRLRDLWAQVACTSKSWGSSWQFVHRYCHAQTDSWGALDTTGPHKEGCPKCDESTAELEARLGYWFDRKDLSIISKDLPPKRRAVTRVQVGKPSKIKIQHGSSPIESAIATAAALKLETAVELAADTLLNKGKVVLVGNRLAWLPAAAEELHRAINGVREIKESLWIRTASGAIAAPERVALAREYLQRKGPAILIATMDSISESIDLQDTDHMIVAALPYTPGQVTQLEGRVSRIGQQRPVLVTYLVAEGTIDERIKRTLLDKLDAIVRVNEDTMGANFGALFSRDEKEVMDELNAWLSETNYVEEEA